MFPLRAPFLWNRQGFCFLALRHDAVTPPRALSTLSRPENGRFVVPRGLWR
jgi:hypothetical protein